MVQPWLEAGHTATIVDLQHPDGVTRDGNLTRIRGDVRNMNCLTRSQHFDIVFAFPPCTDLANSGARWFREKGLGALIGALQTVEACRQLCEDSGAPWMIENPVGQLAAYWRKPDYVFDPCDYGDPYTKKTCLWTGGGFVLPWRSRVEPTEGSKMHRLPPSPQSANLRSETPPGFARAVFGVNSRQVAE
jgi:hypothetical protein